jgi:hypothetical protein
MSTAEFSSGLLQSLNFACTHDDTAESSKTSNNAETSIPELPPPPSCRPLTHRHGNATVDPPCWQVPQKEYFTTVRVVAYFSRFGFASHPMHAQPATQEPHHTALANSDVGFTLPDSTGMP